MTTEIDWRDYIHADPRILVGKPVLRGTRLSVEFLMSLFGAGWTLEDVRSEYELTREQVQAVFAYAADVLQDEAVFPIPTAR